MAALIFVYVFHQMQKYQQFREQIIASSHLSTPADLTKMKHESGAAESDVCGAKQVEKNRADIGFSSRRNKEELLQETEGREGKLRKADK